MKKTILFSMTLIVLSGFILIGCDMKEEQYDSNSFNEVNNNIDELDNDLFNKKINDPSNYEIDEDLFATDEDSRSICGDTNDMQDVNSYDGSLGVTKAFVAKHKQPVGVMERGNWKYCSGTLIGPDLFLTANHCVDSNTTSDVVSFNYETDAAGNLLTEDRRQILEVVEDGSANRVDYAILRLAGSPGNKYGWARIKASTPAKNVTLAIIQHPGGGLKKVEAGFYDHTARNFFLYSDLDTQGGSSGSGVLNAEGFLVAVHTNGGCSSSGGTNQGVRMTRILEVSNVLPVKEPKSADIIWQNSSGQVAAWFIDRGQLVSAKNIGTPVGSDWEIEGVGDVDGDGTSDIVWQNSSGQVYYWLIHNGQQVGGTNIHTPVGSDWELKGVGDVDGDRTADIIWQNSRGQVHYWPMKNGQRVGGKNISTPVDSNWKLKGVDDVDGDGTADILWQNSDGLVFYWPMKNGQRMGSINIATPYSSNNKLQGAGDINGDGTADILWKNSQGQVRYWPMKKGQWTGGRIKIGTPAGSHWEIKGFGSLD